MSDQWLDTRTKLDEHEGCGTDTCCGSCDHEETVNLEDATLEQTREAAIDLMVNVLGIRQDMMMHLEILGIVAQQLDELGATDEDMETMTQESLRRFGVPEELIAEAAADSELINMSVDKAL